MRIERGYCGYLRSVLAGPKLLLPLVLLLGCLGSARAQFNYTYSGGGVTITGYTGSGGAVTIPDTISGNPVTGIGSNAFANCTSLTSVTIPSSVNSIGSYAFYGCRSLTSATIPSGVPSIGDFTFGYCNSLASVTIPATVTRIGNAAFVSCFSLTNVTIPSSVTTLGSSVFMYCRSLGSISVDAANLVFSTADGVLYDKAQTSLVQYPGGKVGSYTMPASVTSVWQYALYACGGLTSISVDPSNSAFSAFDGVLFDKNQTTLVQYPAGNSSTSYVVPASVTGLGSFAFYGCNNLTSITADSLSSSFAGKDGVLFDKSLTTLVEYPPGRVGAYTIPAGTTGVAGYAFFGCPGLTAVTIAASVGSLGNSAFRVCTSLSLAAFQGDAPTMGSSVFGSNASGFTVDYFNDKTGFTSPTWNGYPAVNAGDSSPVATWLHSNGFAYTADLHGTPNGDGVPLLMAYALKLDPTRNQSNSLPKPVLSANQMSLTFYAGSADVAYSVEASTDLQNWSAAGVTISGPDANNFRTATIPLSGAACYMRLKVTH